MLIPFVFAVGVYVGQKDKVDIALYESELMANVVNSMSTYLAVKEGNLVKLKTLTDDSNMSDLVKLMEQQEYTPDQEYFVAKVRALNSLAEYWRVQPPVNPFRALQGANAGMADEWDGDWARIQKMLTWAQEKCKSQPSIDCKSPVELLK